MQTQTQLYNTMRNIGFYSMKLSNFVKSAINMHSLPKGQCRCPMTQRGKNLWTSTQKLVKTTNDKFRTVNSNLMKLSISLFKKHLNSQIGLMQIVLLVMRVKISLLLKMVLESQEITYHRTQKLLQNLICLTFRMLQSLRDQSLFS